MHAVVVSLEALEPVALDEELGTDVDMVAGQLEPGEIGEGSVWGPASLPDAGGLPEGNAARAEVDRQALTAQEVQAREPIDRH